MKRRISILIMIALGLVLALFALKIVFLLTAKPKVTVDYVTEYNKFARPKNYDLNENAVPYYQKAFDVLIEMPNKLWTSPWYSGWPNDFNDSDRTILLQWIASNDKAVEYFKIATSKPYYWVERKVRDANLPFDIIISDIDRFRELNKAMIWNAKLNASQGNFPSAFEGILNCYRAGKHKCRAKLLLLDQGNGLEVKKAAIKTAFIILDKTKSTIDNKLLESFQNTLQLEIDNDAYVPSIQAEIYFVLGGLQRVFLDGESGRLSWRIGWNIIPMCSSLDSKWPIEWQTKWNNMKRRLDCFTGPTRYGTIKQFEQVISISDQMMAKTPWQVKYSSRDYLKKIKSIERKNFFLDTIDINPQHIFCLYNNTNIETRALVTVFAILRFKAETGQFPKTLENLVLSGYLANVPQDPYRNGPLIYKFSQNNFMLYSIGPNFEDDGGINESADIIFWPVKEMRDNIQKSDNECGCP